MKILIVIPLIFLLVWSGCSEESSTTGINSKVSKNFTVYDELTNHPVENAYVTLTVRNYGVYSSSSALTDASGSCKIEISPSASLIQLLVTKDDYVYLCAGAVTSKIYLTPAALIRFHIKNTDTKLSDDLFFVNYGDNFCSGSSIISLEGANIDTVFTVYARPGEQTLEFITWSNKHRSEYFKTVNLVSRETTFVYFDY